MSNYQDALQRLWDGRCTVYTQTSTVNTSTGRNVITEVVAIQNEPCRLSFSSAASTTENSEAALVQQSVKLFISNAVSIPPGSKLVITQEGVTETYKRTGKPATYRYHQEIALELFKEWA